MSELSVVGLGEMGTALASTLLRSVSSVTVWMLAKQSPWSMTVRPRPVFCWCNCGEWGDNLPHQKPL